MDLIVRVATLEESFEITNDLSGLEGLAIEACSRAVKASLRVTPVIGATRAHLGDDLAGVHVRAGLAIRADVQWWDAAHGLIPFNLARPRQAADDSFSVVLRADIEATAC
jgi:hypothetical protein